METKKNRMLKQSLTAVFLTLVMLFTTFAPQMAGAFRVKTARAASSGEESGAGYEEVEQLPFDSGGFKSGAVWTNTLSRLAAVTDVTPAGFKNLSYTPIDETVVLDSKPNTTAGIAAKAALADIGTAAMKVNGLTSAGLDIAPNAIIAEGGYVKKSALQSAIGADKMKNGTVVLDKETGTAFKLATPFANSTDPKLKAALNDTYVLTQPMPNEIFKSLELGGANGETVDLTYGNFRVSDDIAECVNEAEIMSNLAAAKASNNIMPMAAGDTGTAVPTASDDKYDFRHIRDVKIPLQFNHKKLKATTKNGEVAVDLSGGLAFGDFKLVGHYSLPFGSYKAAFQFSQEFYLIVEFDANIREEVNILLFGLDIPFGIGSVRGGLYLVIGIDGNFRLEIEAREWTNAKFGVGGATFLCLPASIHPIFSLNEIGVYGNVEMNGRLNAYAKFGPMIDITICGVNLVGAGAFLGAGVDVAVDGIELDILLYGIINIYAKAFGKTFNIINQKPKILRKRQKDAGGYQVNIVDCFVYPGRVGGTIMQEPDEPLDPFVPAPNLPYRIKVIRSPSKTDYYPAGTATGTKDTWPKTNQYGEFFEGDGKAGYGTFGDENAGLVLAAGDKVSVEFYDTNGGPYSSAEVSPTLPFDSVSIFQADCFNDYVTGQVNPKRLRDWTKPPEDEAKGNNTKLVYYANNIIGVKQVLLGTTSFSSALAQAKTDSMGRFDTRQPFSEANGATNVAAGGSVNPNFDVSAVSSDSYKYPSFFEVSIKYNGITNPAIEYFKPEMAPFIITREIKLVEGSQKKDYEILGDGRILDSVQYDEYIYIMNPNGTRALTADELNYYVSSVFSCVDTWVEQFSTLSYTLGNNTVTMPKPQDYKLVTTVKDGTSVTMISQRVTVQWVWQVHPDPVVITSDNHAALTTDGGVFQVTADGLCPEYWLEGAPEGVKINPDTGKLTVPAGLAPGTYTFTVSAKQNVRQIGETPPVSAWNLWTPLTLEEYYGHDPMPPHEQTFTLTITAATAGVTVEPPAITFDYGGNQQGQQQGYSVEYGALFKTAYTLTGTAPVSVTVSAVDSYGVTATNFSHNLDSRTISAKNLNPGIYTVTVTAENSAGTDTAVFTLTVKGDAPSFVEGAYGGYVFGRTEEDDGPLDFQIYVSSSTSVAFSIIPTESNQTAFPDMVFIDADTGELTVGPDIAPGIYYFTIRAENLFGTAEQECVLWVGEENESAAVPAAYEASASKTASANPAETAALELKAVENTVYSEAVKSLKARAEVHLAVIETTAKLGKIFEAVVLNPGLTFTPPATPLNNVTIFWDDPYDVYTNDRKNINGAAEFIGWSGTVTIDIIDKEPIRTKLHAPRSAWPDIGYFTGYIITEKFREGSYNFNEAYHEYYTWSGGEYRGPILQLSWEKFREITAREAGTLYVPGNGIWGSGSGLGDALGKYFDYMMDNYHNPVINPGHLDYGSTLKAMDGAKGGLFDVGLNDFTGTVIVGEYFDALAGAKGSSLSFVQDGATITFNQKDLTKGAPIDAMLDFGYTANSVMEQEMLAAAGVTEAQGFGYSFATHGELPGMASFGIETGFAAGTSVNVYKYDSGGFTLIAGNTKVGAGGVVTYKNNTMSDYLITTETIAGASVSKVARTENGSSGDKAGYFFEQLLYGDYQIYAAIAVVALLAAVLLIVFFRGRKKRA